ncbi:3-phosphoshikimate 1-carboxyvinyltransferase [Paenibacillus solisilvae]|uniref:3-phosphoshikimate 1-carboxyvinyltransferase n=1 Tax=Paenibacillus solisilvae TaxID=2486751 RepID=A0ABW0VWN4_9BACL
MDNQSTVEPDLEARSPWSNYKDKPGVILTPPAVDINGTLLIPGSKSMTNRALLLAAVAKGTSRLEGVLRSDDSYWCLNSLSQLGVQVTVEGQTAVVEGVNGRWPRQTGEIYVGAAGTLARFLPGLLAAGNGEWRIRGSKRMSERPLAPLLQELAALGAGIAYEDREGCLPCRLEAAGLRGGNAVLSGSVSSQFISGMLMCAPLMEQALMLHIEGTVVQREYVEMTLAMMRMFGIESTLEDNGQKILVRRAYQAPSTPIMLEPDVSTCGYFWSLAALTNGRIRIQGISRHTLQPDIELITVLERMGCGVVHGDDFIEVCGTKELKGDFTVSMGKWSDQTLTVAALAVFADGPVTMIDAAHIRHHECDRISAICMELRKMGIQVDEHHDGLTVYPGIPQPALLNPHDDHRMAMALALIGARVPGIRIADPGCVSKTCPDYWDRLERLGFGVDWG